MGIIMNKIVILALIMIFSISIYSIDFIWSDSKPTELSRNNGQNLYYHTNSEDMLFYGSEKWAVNFNVNDILEKPAGAIPDTFVVHQLKIYMAMDVDTTTVSLYNNFNNQNPPSVIHQPGQLLFSTIVENLAQGWNIIDIPTTISIVNVWLVVEFKQYEEPYYVAASAGGGQHSYFFERQQQIHGNPGFFRSLYNIGYQAEFLFNLVGSFKNPIMMIDILDFSNPFTINYAEPYFPSFTLVNNSPFTANDVYIKIIMRNTANTIVHSDSMIVNNGNPLAENSEICVNPDNVRAINLSEQASQYSIDLEVGCNPGNYSLFKKRKVFEIDVFKQNKENTLLEVFTHSIENQNIANIIEYCEARTSDIIFYFPNSIDPLYTYAANQRNNQYSHQGIEYTYFNGILKNCITDDLFYEKLNNDFQLSQTSKTFITSRSEMTAFVDSSYNLKISINVHNSETYITSGNANRLYLKMAFIQPISHNDKEILIMSQFIMKNGNMKVSVPLTREASITTEYIVPLYSITLLNDNVYNDLSILAWVEDDISKKIYYHNLYPLNDTSFTPNTDNIVNIHPQIFVYPNPVKSDEHLNIKFDESLKINDVKATLFNIKGQKVYTNNLTTNTLVFNEKIANCSGIYLLKIDYIESGKKAYVIEKILLLK